MFFDIKRLMAHIGVQLEKHIYFHFFRADDQGTAQAIHQLIN